MDSIEKMTFEEALEELKTIFEKMEMENLPLEDAVVAYERSMQLKKHCELKLKNAQMRVEKITQSKPLETEPLDT